MKTEKIYGKPQSYSSQSCSTRKTVGRKNNPDVDLTICVVPKYLSVDMASCDIQK